MEESTFNTLNVNFVPSAFVPEQYNNPQQINNGFLGLRNSYVNDDDEMLEEDDDFDNLEITDMDADNIFASKEAIIPENIQLTAYNTDLPIFHSTYYYRKLNMPYYTEKMWQYLAANPILSDQIQLYDNWIKNNLVSNIQSRHNTQQDNYIYYENIRTIRPTTIINGKETMLTPQKCRNMEITYAANVYCDMVLYNNNFSQIARIDNILLFQIPIMINSVLCVLRDRSPEQLLLMGEDPRDIGGYFIIKGLERIVLGQEQLALNRIMLMNDKTYGVICRLTANTLKGTSLFQLVTHHTLKQMIVAHLSSIRNIQQKQNKNMPKSKQDNNTGVNVLHLFQLLIFQLQNIQGQYDGSVYDSVEFYDFVVQQVTFLLKQYIPVEQQSKCLAKLADNIFDLSIHRNPVVRIMEHMSLVEDVPNQIKKINNILMNDLFPHVNDIPGPAQETVQENINRIYRYKLNLLTSMLAKYLQYFCGYRLLDNRNSINRKRFDWAGRVMEQFTRTAWRKVLNDLQKTISPQHSLNNIANTLINNSANIGKTFEVSFAGSKWGPRGSKTKNNVAAILDVTTVISSYGHRLTANVPVFRKDSRVSNREVVLSQYGKICPATTPDGNNCGLLKQMALLTRVTLENSDISVIKYLIDNKLVAEQADYNYDTQIMVYGKLIGWVNGTSMYQDLLLQRQAGLFSNQVSVVWEKEDRTIYLDFGPSILVHPVLALDNTGTPVLDKEVWENGRRLYTKLSEANVSEWFRHGGVLYMSAWEQEQEHIKIADRYEDVVLYLQERANAQRDFDEANKQLTQVNNGEKVLIERYGEVQLTKQLAQQRLLKAQQRISSKESYILRGALTTLSQEEMQQLVKEAEQDLLEIENGKNVKREMLHTVLLNADIATDRVNSTKLQLEKLRKIKPYTHMQFDGQATVGLLCSLIAAADQDQGPRVTYQINMSKQATGEHHPNYRNRTDKKSRRLLYQQEPIAQTESFRYLGLHYRAPGQTLMLALMAYPGTEEDGAVWNSSAIDAGMFRLAKQLAYSSNIKLQPPEVLLRPALGETEKSDRYDALNDQGLPYIGAYISQGKAIIGKEIKNELSGNRNQSVYMRFTEEGVVQWVKSYTNTNGEKVIVVYLTITPRPQLGDKGAGAHAQKNTINKQVHVSNLPYTVKDGISPDIIINPSSIPSRMTVGYLREIYFSKAAALTGSVVNMTAFRTYQKLDKVGWDAARLANEHYEPIQKARDTLKAYGYDEMGYEKMISGYTGKELDIPIFMGAVKFETLKHRAIDKGQFRGIGRVKTQTRQPNEGRASGGGLRIGEMEKDSLIGHGAAYLTVYFLMHASDAYTTVFCKKCGIFAEFNSLGKEKQYICRKCQAHKIVAEKAETSLNTTQQAIVNLQSWANTRMAEYNNILNTQGDSIELQQWWNNSVAYYQEQKNILIQQLKSAQQKVQDNIYVPPSFGKATVPYVLKLFMQMMTSIGLAIYLDLKDYQELYQSFTQQQDINTIYNQQLDDIAQSIPRDNLEEDEE